MHLLLQQYFTRTVDYFTIIFSYCRNRSDIYASQLLYFLRKFLAIGEVEASAYCLFFFFCYFLFCFFV